MGDLVLVETMCLQILEELMDSHSLRPVCGLTSPFAFQLGARHRLELCALGLRLADCTTNDGGSEMHITPIANDRDLTKRIQTVDTLHPESLGFGE